MGVLDLCGGGSTLKYFLFLRSLLSIDSLLFGWQDDWNKTQSIIYVTIAQMFAGIAKDLTKLGGKTVTKLVTPDEQETKLFKLVSLITGWKNSLKGVGYFLGSALLSVSYFLALGAMMGLIVLAMPWAILGLDNSLGTAKKSNASWHDVFKLDNKRLNLLSLARLFLFASRDFWFEVPLPFFLRSPSCEGLGTEMCTVNGDVCNNGAECNADLLVCQNLNTGGGCGGLGLDRVVVGAILGGYIILYGQVQSWTPQLVTGPLKQTYACLLLLPLSFVDLVARAHFISSLYRPPNKYTEMLWGLINCIPTGVMAIVMAFGEAFQDNNFTAMITWLMGTGFVQCYFMCYDYRSSHNRLAFGCSHYCRLCHYFRRQLVNSLLSRGELRKGRQGCCISRILLHE